MAPPGRATNPPPSPPTSSSSGLFEDLSRPLRVTGEGAGAAEELHELDAAEASRRAYQSRLREAGYGDISTEITPATPFYYAEEYHQQYLAKNPRGYRGVGGTGVSCPIGPGVD